MRETPILDAHTHVGSSFLNCYVTRRTYEVEELIREMDRCGIQLACISGGGLPHRTKELNRLALDAVRKYPRRLIGFVRVSPWIEGSIEEIDRYVGKEGFRGIKLHPLQDGYCLLLEPRLDSIFEKAAKYGVPILVHSGHEPWTMPGQVADQALRYPEVTVIMAHSCLNNLYQHVEASVRRARNVVLETSIGAVFSPRLIGKDRVVYGSDWPTTSMRSELLKVYEAPLTEEERSDVLGASMVRILGLEV